MFGKRIRQLKENVKYKKPEHYYEINDENQAIINVGAENFDDVFSPYCYKGGDSLSSELVAYLEEKAEGIPLEYDLVIRFHVKNASDSKREEIEKALRTNFRNDIQGIKRQLKRNDAFSLAFFGIGMILFMLYMFLPEGTNKIVMGFLELFAWVMAWEALDAFFLDRRSMQIERLKKYRLWASKVEIIEFENY